MDGEMIHINSTVLAHHGIKDMKWGVRRYQNPDGSLTPLGRQRYGKGGEGSEGSGSGDTSTSGSTGHSGGKAASSGSETKPTVKSAYEMTDSELRDRINRMNMEKQYKQLVAEMNPEKKSVAKKLLAEAGENLGRRMLGLAVDKVIDAARSRSEKGESLDMDQILKGDVEGMDPDTIKQVAQWYENAQKITRGRQAMERGSGGRGK